MVPPAGIEPAYLQAFTPDARALSYGGTSTKEPARGTEQLPRHYWVVFELPPVRASSTTVRTSIVKKNTSTLFHNRTTDMVKEK